jgi:hypothetical protein
MESQSLRLIFDRWEMTPLLGFIAFMRLTQSGLWASASII